MNMELLEKVAQWLEAGAPHEVTGGMGFDMEYEGVEVDLDNGHMKHRPWNNPACGTVGCIAGAINQFAGNNPLETGMRSAITSLGCDYYDEDVYDKFDSLFYPGNLEAYNSSPQQAAKVVRHFMATGEVDWKKAFEV